MLFQAPVTSTFWKTIQENFLIKEEKSIGALLQLLGGIFLQGGGFSYDIFL